MHAASPLPARDRDDRIDALRGFAIAGVLLMNLPMFMRTPLNAGWVEAMVPGWGNLGPALFAWLGQGKFLAILAGLYGVGIARRGETGAEAASTSARRLGFLAVLGVAHGMAWPGDILVGWALTGALLLVTRRVPPWIVVTVGLLLPAALAGAGYLDLIAPARRAALASHARKPGQEARGRSQPEDERTGHRNSSVLPSASSMRRSGTDKVAVSDHSARSAASALGLDEDDEVLPALLEARCRARDTRT